MEENQSRGTWGPDLEHWAPESHGQLFLLGGFIPDTSHSLRRLQDFCLVLFPLYYNLFLLKGLILVT